MKRYDQLTNEELRELPQDQIQKLIDLEIAHAGILPEEVPTVMEPIKPEIKPTVEAWEANGIFFKSEEEAKKFLDLETYNTTYCSDYSYKYLKLEKKQIINKKLFFEKKIINSFQGEIDEYNRLKEVYDNLWDRYNSFISDTSEIRNKVHEKINLAFEEAAEIDKISRLYNRYLDLSDGDENLAVKFLLEAYKDKDSQESLNKFLKDKVVE